MAMPAVALSTRTKCSKGVWFKYYRMEPIPSKVTQTPNTISNRATRVYFIIRQSLSPYSDGFSYPAILLIS